MKHAHLFLFFLVAFSLFMGCEEKITGNFGNPDAVRVISVKDALEFDSLGTVLLNEYELTSVEEKDSFWLRSYKYKDTLSVKYDTSYVDASKNEISKIDTIYTTKDTLLYYNDQKSGHFIRFDTIRLKYSDKETEVRFLIESNGKWKASEIAFSDSTTQALWAFPVNQYGGGDSYLRIKAKKGLPGSFVWKSVTQQVYTPDSSALFQFNIIRKGLKTP